jgi:membrane protein DedA with SNARE-associated domain
MYFILVTAASVLHLLTGTYSTISTFIIRYAYAAVIVLMGLESASLPIPSEVVLPLIGSFAAKNLLNPYVAFVCTMIGTVIGISVDYAIAYFVGKDVVYKHLGALHIKKETLDSFDRWFSANGDFAVFVSRLLPVVRGLISFPAGFAQMPLKKFFFYSLAGSAIWNAALIAFGYYALSASNADILFAAIAAFAIVLYLIYHVALKKIKGAGRRPQEDSSI